MEGVDTSRLEPWLAARLGLEPPVGVRRLPGGRSNITVAVTDRAGTTVVVRRPPLGRLEATAHDMAREYRILAALHPTAVPVPRPMALCEDVAVIGAPFSVMSFVEGVVVGDAAQADAMPATARRRAADTLVDALVDLHALDPGHVGLGELSRSPDGYVERLLRRWSAQFAAVAVDPQAAVARVADELGRRIPRQQRGCVVHGDFRLGNAVVRPDGAVAAVLDWELCALGDPLADLGYLLMTWEHRVGVGSLADGPPAGFPTATALVQRYAAASGLDVADVEYYTALQAWRMAIILEGVRARYLRGGLDTGAVDVAGLRRMTEGLLADAAAALDRLA